MIAGEALSGALLSAAAATAVYGIRQAAVGPPPGRVSRAPEWLSSALILTGAGLFTHAVLRPADVGHEAFMDWWALLGPGVAMLTALAVIATARGSVRRLRGRRRVPSLPDGDLASLGARHDRVRERYGALLTVDRFSRATAEPTGPLRLALAQALVVAGERRADGSGSYAARSAYARAVGELESAWLAVLAEAHGQGVVLPDDRSG
ncbi:hypothetical protein ACIOJE_35005 [Kitasatospora sp. NPDC087861]|uniref:hypothetical protein n=1 Tax=Kitasatospora sp. NPDC087861 TaxID=3364070 RepID=UPI0038235B16